MLYKESEIIAKIAEMSPPFICFLSGSLGAGKTTLVRHILMNEGFLGPVRSPSYNIFEVYTEFQILHMDLYRLENVNKQVLYELGLQDYLSDFKIFIEWPERIQAKSIIPSLQINISVLPCESRVYELV